MLALAASFAAARDDERSFRLAAVAVRSDGVIVAATNGSSPEKATNAHAEARVARKLDKHATVFVARVLRDGAWAMARPCGSCRRKLAARRVRRVLYTIGPDEWGSLTL